MRKQYGCATRSDTNKSVKPQKIAISLKFQIKKEEVLYYEGKTKALISCAVTAKLICNFVFAIENCKFSKVADHLKFILSGQKTSSC